MQTSADLLSLPASRELDALVAEKIFGINAGAVMAGLEVPVLPYSTSISAAWEVVEQLLPHAFELAYRPDDADWMAVFWKTPDECHGDYADTAPFAIVRAALKAVGC